jgi:O-antigen ligase
VTLLDDARTLSVQTERPSIEVVLSAAVLASIPFGPVLSVGSGGGSATVTLSHLVTAVLALHLLFSKLASRVAFRTGLGLGAGSIGLMALPALMSPSLASGTFAFFNYSMGILAGVTVGIVWGRKYSQHLGLIDAGMAFFLLAGAMQLASQFLSASSINALHQNAQTPWGNSNYAAACLVVGSFALLARGRQMGRPRVVALPVIGAICAALMTLSRGAALSVAVGIAILLWTSGSNAWLRVCFRLMSLALPIVALNLIERLETLRYQGSSHADSNISTRFTLYEAAWEDFTKSPLVGNGWVSFRSVSAAAVEQQSFAHNFFLSFLQIGGMAFGLTTIIAFLILFVLAMRRNPYFMPAISAGLAISMSDPFFEGTIGNVLMIAISSLALFANHPANGLRRSQPRVVGKQLVGSSGPLRNGSKGRLVS